MVSYERTLDSFSDETLTSVRYSDWNGLWYASLDLGPDRQVGDPDFASCGSTEAEARKLCARLIRADQRGVGKFAPHNILRPDSYEYRFRACRYWARKESEAASLTHSATSVPQNT